MYRERECTFSRQYLGSGVNLIEATLRCRLRLKQLDAFSKRAVEDGVGECAITDTDTLAIQGWPFHQPGRNIRGTHCSCSKHITTFGAVALMAS